MAAGTATLELLKAQELDVAAARKGDHLLRQLRALMSKYRCIGDVRGRGLMLGIEFIAASTSKEQSGRVPHPDGQLAARVQRECLRRGVIIELGGRFGGVARLLPPLTISMRDLDEVVSVLDHAISAVDGTAG